MGAEATPELVVYDRAGDATTTLNRLAHEGVKHIGYSAQGQRPWHLWRKSGSRCEASGARPKGTHRHVEKQQIWVQQTQGQVLWQTLEMAGSEVYQIVRIGQIDVKIGLVENGRQNGIGANQSGKMERELAAEGET